MPISILEATNNERSYTECQSWKTALLSQPTGHGAWALDRPGCSGGRDVRSTGVPGFPRCWKLSWRLCGLRQAIASQELAAAALPVRILTSRVLDGLRPKRFRACLLFNNLQFSHGRSPSKRPLSHFIGSPGITSASASRATAIHRGHFPVVPEMIARIRARIARMKVMDIWKPQPDYIAKQRLESCPGWIFP